MREKLLIINQKCQGKGLPYVRVRVGICTGSVVAGCLGSSSRMKYTTIGDPVNTAARLESLDKQSFGLVQGTTDCRILISESTRELLGNRFLLTPVGSFELKGKEQPVQVFSVDGYADSTVVELHGREVKL